MGVGHSHVVERVLRCEFCSARSSDDTEEYLSPRGPIKTENVIEAPTAASPLRIAPEQGRGLTASTLAREKAQRAATVPASRGGGGQQLFGLKGLPARGGAPKQGPATEEAAGGSVNTEVTSGKGTRSTDGGASVSSPYSSQPGTPRRHEQRKLYTVTSLMEGAQNLRAWDDVTKEVAEKPEGLYLLCLPNNNGSWIAQWSREVLPEAWAFSVPENIGSVPQHKFGVKGREELARGIFSSPTLFCTGFVHFLKTVRRYHGSFVLLETGAKCVADNSDLYPPVLLGFHDTTSQKVSVMSLKSTEKLPSITAYDGVACVTGVRGPSALAELTRPAGAKVPIAAFVTVGTTYGDGIHFVD